MVVYLSDCMKFPNAYFISILAFFACTSFEKSLEKKPASPPATDTLVFFSWRSVVFEKDQAELPDMAGAKPKVSFFVA